MRKDRSRRLVDSQTSANKYTGQEALLRDRGPKLPEQGNWLEIIVSGRAECSVMLKALTRARMRKSRTTFTAPGIRITVSPLTQ